MKRMMCMGVLLALIVAGGCAEIIGPEQKTLGGGNVVDTAKGPLTPVDYSQYGKPPIPVRVLLLIPDEFSHYTYMSTYNGRQIQNPLGRDAENELRKALRVEFESLEVWPVRSETKAIEMLSPSDPYNSEIRNYDYVVIPEFIHVESSVNNDKYSFGVDFWTRFYAKDESSITIKGHGETMTGKYAASTPENSARLTVQYAVSAILDGIEKKRGAFVHSDF